MNNLDLIFCTPLRYSSSTTDLLGNLLKGDPLVLIELGWSANNLLRLINMIASTTSNHHTFPSVVALKRSLFDTGSDPTSESVVKPLLREK